MYGECERRVTERRLVLGGRNNNRRRTRWWRALSATPAAAASTRQWRWTTTIVCDNDFGWVQDGTRELAGPHSAAFQRRQLDDLAARAVDYVVVRGSVEQRIAQVLGRLGTRPGVSGQPVQT